MPASDPSTLAGQIAIVSAAPIPFLIVICAVGAAIYFFIDKFIYNTRLTNRDSSIDNLKVQIEDYKERLKGKSPEQAISQITTLEQQISEQRFDLSQAREDLAKAQDVISAMEKKIYVIQNPPRQPNDIYFQGAHVGLIGRLVKTETDGLQQYEKLQVVVEIKPGSIIEIQSAKYRFIKFESFSAMKLGLNNTFSYHPVWLLKL